MEESSQRAYKRQTEERVRARIANTMFEYDDELLKLIPPTFDLDNYKDTANLDAEGWYAHLRRRKIAFAHSLVKKDRGKQDSINDVLEIIRDGTDYQWCPYEREYELVESVNKNQYEFLMLMEKEDQQIASIASVNVNIPDDILVKSFLSWVHNERQRIGRNVLKKAISNATFRRWHEARLLQYMDIISWHKLTGTVITDGQAGMILFPDDNRGGVAERIRKTTKPLARGLERKGMLHALYAQVRAR